MRRKIVLLGMIVSLLLSILTPLVNASSIDVPSEHSFGLPTQGTYISFSNDQLLSTIYRQDDYWFFGDYGFRIQYVNLTITDFFESDLDVLRVEFGSTGVLRVKSDTEPSEISGDSAHSWDQSGISIIEGSGNPVKISWETLGSGEGVSEEEETFAGRGSTPEERIETVVNVLPQLGLFVLISGVVVIGASAIVKKVAKPKRRRPQGTTRETRKSRGIQRDKKGRFK